MPLIHGYIVHKQGTLWEIRLGGRPLSAQPTYVEALNVADALATAAVQRGEPSRAMIRTFDGVAIEFPLRLYLQRVTGTDPPGATASTKGSLHSGVTSFWPAANNTM